MALSEALLLRLESWLQQIGFAKGNPFAIGEAARESQLLPEFFVDTGYYDLIWGNPRVPQSTLVFAPRGSGKTAYRVMVQNQCYPLSAHSDVLAILYTSFDIFFQPHLISQLARIDLHIKAILNKGLYALLNTLCQKQEMVNSIFPPQRCRLAWFYRTFAPQALSPIELLERIQAIEPDFHPPWESFRESVRKSNLRQPLAYANLLGNPVLQLLADLVDCVPEPLETQLSPAQIFTEFIQEVQRSGIRAIYILVDRLDEIPETANSPQIIVELLEPLLANLTLMETPGVAFKVFLPHLALEAIKASPSIRLDRLRTYEVVWTDALLSEMLRKRLVAYSEGRIRSLAQISAASLTETIDQEIVRVADGSPRRLLRMGELLFLQHIRKTDQESLLLNENDWRKGHCAFFKEYMPLLSVDKSAPQVFVGSRRVFLTPLEHKFLLALYNSKGVCDKERLVNKVWNVEEGVTDQAISRLVRRIREKIEPFPSAPLYLITEHSFGFRLEHVDWVSSQKVEANHGTQQKPATNPSGTQDKFYELTRKREGNSCN